MKYEFDGISTEVLDDKTKDSFSEYYETVFIKSETFEVELSTKKVKLHTYIEHIDMSEFEDDTDDQIITIGVVPDFKSLHKAKKENILDQFDEADREYYKHHANELTYDNYNYGYMIPLRSMTVKRDEVEHTIDSAMAVHFAVEGLIGFELDKIKNKIGNTGWDFLDDYCLNKDPFKKILSKYKRVK